MPRVQQMILTTMEILHSQPYMSMYLLLTNGLSFLLYNMDPLLLYRVTEPFGLQIPRLIVMLGYTIL